VIKVNVKLDIQRARRELSHMQKEVNRAAIVALTRVATTARKEADQEIRQRLALKSGTVKEALRIIKYRNVLVVDIDATGKPIALREWNARETRKGVTFLVAKGRPRKVYTRSGRKGFIVSKYGRHVFVRTTADPPGPAKAKVSKVYGPSIPQYFVTKSVTGRMIKVANVRWPIEFEREIKFRVARANKYT
jgi:hypothetical protein